MASGLKRPGAGSRMNTKAFQTSGASDGSFLQHILDATHYKAQTRGYYSDDHLPASRGSSAKPVLIREHPVAPSSPSPEPLTWNRRMGSLAIGLLDETLSKMVPITMRLTMKANKKGMLTATITGVQHGANAKLEEEMANKHMEKLAWVKMQGPDEPIELPFILQTMLPFAEIAGYEGSKVGMGRAAVAVGSGIVRGIVKSFVPMIGAELNTPYDVEVDGLADGSMQVKVRNYTLSHEFTGDREKYWTTVAMKHMRQAGVYIANEEDQEDLEAESEELIEEFKAVEDGAARQQKMASFMRDHDEKKGQAIENARQEAMEAPRRVAEEKARQQQAAQQAAVVKQLNDPAATASRYHQHEDFLGSSTDQAELDDLLEKLGQRQRARGGRTFKEFARERARNQPNVKVDDEDESDAEESKYDSDEAEADVDDIIAKYESPENGDEASGALEGAIGIGDNQENNSGEGSEIVAEQVEEHAVTDDVPSTKSSVSLKRKIDDFDDNEVELETMASKKPKVSGPDLVETTATEEPRSRADSVLSPAPDQVSGLKRKAGEDQTGIKKAKGVDGVSRTTQERTVMPQQSDRPSSQLTWLGSASNIKLSDDQQYIYAISGAESIASVSIPCAEVTKLEIDVSVDSLNIFQGQHIFKVDCSGDAPEDFILVMLRAVVSLNPDVESGQVGEPPQENKVQTQVQDRPKLGPQSQSNKIKQKPSKNQTPAEPQLPTTSSTWPADDPGLKTNLRPLFNKVDPSQLNKANWTGLLKPAIKTWLQTHAPDYLRGNGSAKKGELEEIIWTVLETYPVPGDKRYPKSGEVPKHRNGIYALMDGNNRNKKVQTQEELFRKSKLATGM